MNDEDRPRIRQRSGGADKQWADAVRRAVCRRASGEPNAPQRLDLLADKVVSLGLEGDIAAIREVGDRLDGKANVRIEETNVSVSFVVRLPQQLPPEEWAKTIDHYQPGSMGDAEAAASSASAESETKSLAWLKSVEAPADSSEEPEKPQHAVLDRTDE